MARTTCIWTIRTKRNPTCWKKWGRIIGYRTDGTGHEHHYRRIIQRRAGFWVENGVIAYLSTRHVAGRLQRICTATLSAWRMTLCGVRPTKSARFWLRGWRLPKLNALPMPSEDAAQHAARACLFAVLCRNPPLPTTLHIFHQHWFSLYPPHRQLSANRHIQVQIRRADWGFPPPKKRQTKRRDIACPGRFQIYIWPYIRIKQSNVGGLFAFRLAVTSKETLAFSGFWTFILIMIW